jgi:DNA-binding LytR/AlgR family response regulator
MTNNNYETVVYNDLFQYKVNGRVSFEDKKKIKFFQVNSRKLIMHTTSGIESFYGSIEKLGNELLEDGFIRVHKSYLVNYRYIKQFMYNRLVLHDGTEITVSRKYSKDARNYIMQKLKKNS